MPRYVCEDCGETFEAVDSRSLECPNCGEGYSPGPWYGYACENCGAKFAMEEVNSPPRDPEGFFTSYGPCPTCGEERLILHAPPHEGPSRTEKDDYDEAFDAAVTLEMESGQIRKGLWAKALAEAGGSEDEARAVYFRLRVEQLKAEYRQRWAEHQREVGDVAPVERPQTGESPSPSPWYECENCGAKFAKEEIDSSLGASEDFDSAFGDSEGFFTSSETCPACGEERLVFHTSPDQVAPPDTFTRSIDGLGGG